MVCFVTTKSEDFREPTNLFDDIVHDRIGLLEVASEQLLFGIALASESLSSILLRFFKKAIFATFCCVSLPRAIVPTDRLVATPRAHCFGAVAVRGNRFAIVVVLGKRAAEVEQDEAHTRLAAVLRSDGTEPNADMSGYFMCLCLSVEWESETRVNLLCFLQLFVGEKRRGKKY